MYFPTQSELQEMHQLCIDSYTGVGGYYTGDYLIEFPRETDKAQRVEYSSYVNNVDGVVESLNTPVFSNDIDRDGMNELQQAFTLDATGNKVSLTSFLENVGAYHQLLGNVFIVMDNFKSVPENMQEAISERIYPYLYYKLPTEIYEYEKDQFGNLTEISFYYETVKIEGSSQPKKVYRHISPMSCYNFYIEGNKREKIADTITDGLGFLPVIMTGDTILPVPSTYSLCSLAKMIYNQMSEKRVLERNESFSLLVLASDDPKENIELGSNNVIWVNPESNITPQFISPDASLLSGIGDEITRSQDMFANAASRMGAIPVQGQSTKSGEALKMEFVGSSYALTAQSKLFESIEGEVFTLFGLYVDNMPEVVVTYDKNFNPTYTQLEIDNKALIQAMEQNVSPTATKEFAKAYVDNINAMAELGIDEATQSKIDVEIDALPVDIQDQIKTLMDIDSVVDSPIVKKSYLGKFIEWIGVKVDDQELTNEALENSVVELDAD